MMIIKGMVGSIKCIAVSHVSSGDGNGYLRVGMAKKSSQLCLLLSLFFAPALSLGLLVLIVLTYEVPKESVQFVSVIELLSLVTGGKLGAFWRKVIIMPPSNEDLLDIIKAWYPNLEPISEKLIGGLYIL